MKCVEINDEILFFTKAFSAFSNPKKYTVDTPDIIQVNITNTVLKSVSSRWKYSRAGGMADIIVIIIVGKKTVLTNNIMGNPHKCRMKNNVTISTII